MARPETRPSPPGRGSPSPALRWVALGGSTLMLLLLVRTAWLSDDAFITLRSVDNIVNGFGPRWNVAERVQAYTHPAWLMLITPFYAVTREPFFTVLAIQIALGVLTVGLCCLAVARQSWDAALGVAALAGSKAFVDFSTAGLENPLSHFLLVLFVLAWRRHAAGAKRPAILGLLTSALLLCRLDLGLLVAPMLVFALWRREPRAGLTTFAIGLAPFLAWEAFSFVYYGQLVPNTALAKLPPGVPAASLMAQGLRYLQATWHFDPLTPAVITASVIVLVWSGWVGRMVAAGIALHLFYVVAVGGDFMAGRFLTPALALGVAGTLGLASRPAGPARSGLIAAILLIGGALNPAGPLRTGSDFGVAEAPAGQFDRFGVTDERRFYYSSLGLLPVVQGKASPERHGWAAKGLAVRADYRDVAVASNIGLFGYYAGPGVYIIDRNALADPFLARLPPAPGWRVGHYTRDVPDEYVESRRANRNVIQDPRLHRLYDHVEQISRGNIWSRLRFRELFLSAGTRPEPDR